MRIDDIDGADHDCTRGILSLNRLVSLRNHELKVTCIYDESRLYAAEAPRCKRTVSKHP